MNSGTSDSFNRT